MAISNTTLDKKKKGNIKQMLFWGCVLLVAIVYFIRPDFSNTHLVTTWITVFCISVLGGLLVYDCYTHSYSKSWYPTIGMFGTFLGIFLGLQKFNPDEISNSLPTLLSGLKLAFITSIAGIGFSLLRTILSKLFTSCRIVEKNEYDQLTIMNKNFDSLIKNIGKGFGDQIVKTMNTNFDLLLQKIDKGFKEIGKGLGKGLGEHITDGLAESLNNLTDKLSAKFTESIDNFSDSVTGLSNQVDNLASLQTKYDEQVEKMDTATGKIVDMLNTIAESVDSLEEPLKSIYELGTSSKEAVKSLANISSNILESKKLLDDTHTSISSLAESSTESIRNMAQTYMTETNKFFERLAAIENTQYVQVGNYAAGIVKKLTENLQDVSDALEAAPNAITTLKNRIDNAVKESKK